MHTHARAHTILWCHVLLQKWPIDGGNVETYATRSRRDLLVTGHEDGTVKFWDISHSKSLPTSSMQSYYIATPPHLPHPHLPLPTCPAPPAPPLPAPPHLPLPYPPHLHSIPASALHPPHVLVLPTGAGQTRECSPVPSKLTKCWVLGSSR